MMNVFLAILGEAYTVVRAENDEAAKSKVKTTNVGLVGYLKLVKKVLQAKMRQRRERKAAMRASGKPGGGCEPHGGNDE